MQQLNAYALTGAVIAALTTYFFLQFPGLLIWCAFIGWACFLHSGGERKMIFPVSVSMVLGAVMAWVFALIFVSGVITLPAAVSGAVLVAVIAPIIILASQKKLFSIIPASFYGFATTFAYLAQTPGAFTMESMTGLALGNAVIIVPISLFIGVFLGWLQVTSVGQIAVAKEV